MDIERIPRGVGGDKHNECEPVLSADPHPRHHFFGFHNNGNNKTCPDSIMDTTHHELLQRRHSDCCSMLWVSAEHLVDGE